MIFLLVMLQSYLDMPFWSHVQFGYQAYMGPTMRINFFYHLKTGIFELIFFNKYFCSKLIEQRKRSIFPPSAC